MFIARIHYLVNERLNIWLQQCCRAQEVGDTNLNLVNFGQIFEDVQFNRFRCELPPSIKKINKDTDKEIEDRDDGSRKKRKKQAKQEKNPNLNSKWKLRLNENWDTVFKNKTKDGPVLSFGCQGCLKYHAKNGVCYDNCRWKASHKELSEADLKLLDKYISKLRGE